MTSAIGAANLHALMQQIPRLDPPVTAIDVRFDAVDHSAHAPVPAEAECFGNHCAGLRACFGTDTF